MQRISKEKQIRLRKRKVEKRERKERERKVDFNYNLILTKWRKSKNLKIFIKNKIIIFLFFNKFAKIGFLRNIINIIL